jgi:putative phosphoribosyl transferase
VFARGSGSGRDNPRDRYVVHALQAAGFATLLCDLSTPEERAEPETPFELEKIAHRLEIVSNWAETHEALRGLPLGYFGASTGAAAVLQTASVRFSHAKAIVCRGGRPDLVAREALARVLAPTLFIVGGRDHEVLELNRAAAAELRCPHRIAVVPDASQLFDEPNALTRVAGHTCHWFKRHLLGRSFRPPIAEEASVE